MMAMIHMTVGKSELGLHTTSDDGYDEKGGRGLRSFTGKVFAVFLSLIFIFNSFHYAQAFLTKSYLDLRIKLEKNIFDCHEIVNGKVILTNHIPATYPATFIIKIYKDAKLVHVFFTNITSVPLGKTEFELSNFGITFPEPGEDSIGSWHIIVVKHGERSIYDHVEFNVGQAN